MRRYPYFIVAVVVLILIFVGFFFLTRPRGNTTPPQSRLTMADFADTDSEVSYTVEGVTNADVNHRSIKTTVNNHLVNLTVFSGYQGTILKSESFPNNTNAYKSFLAGLQTVGFISQRRLASNVTFLGKCPLGQKYSFTTSGIDNAPTFLWTTSCTGSKGSFAGNLSNVQQMFNLQVPNYSQFTSDVKLGL